MTQNKQLSADVYKRQTIHNPQSIHNIQHNPKIYNYQLHDIWSDHNRIQNPRYRNATPSINKYYLTGCYKTRCLFHITSPNQNQQVLTAPITFKICLSSRVCPSKIDQLTFTLKTINHMLITPFQNLPYTQHHKRCV